MHISVETRASLLVVPVVRLRCDAQLSTKLHYFAKVRN